MILPDVNLLVYAYNTGAPLHDQARVWWEGCLSGNRPVALPWVVLIAFIRLTSSRKILMNPLPPTAAIGHIRSWLERPSVQILQPGSRHLDLVDYLMVTSSAPGKLATDCHLAALAIEYQMELHSNDSDFSRFSGLRWKNPLEK